MGEIHGHVPNMAMKGMHGVEEGYGTGPLYGTREAKRSSYGVGSHQGHYYSLVGRISPSYSVG